GELRHREREGGGRVGEAVRRGGRDDGARRGQVRRGDRAREGGAGDLVVPVAEDDRDRGARYHRGGRGDSPREVAAEKRALRRDAPEVLQKADRIRSGESVGPGELEIAVLAGGAEQRGAHARERRTLARAP